MRSPACVSSVYGDRAFFIALRRIKRPYTRFVKGLFWMDEARFEGFPERRLRLPKMFAGSLVRR